MFMCMCGHGYNTGFLPADIFASSSCYFKNLFYIFSLFLCICTLGAATIYTDRHEYVTYRRTLTKMTIPHEYATKEDSRTDTDTERHRYTIEQYSALRTDNKKYGNINTEHNTAHRDTNGC
jgi:hypothetical protein